MGKTPVILTILDGWGESPAVKGNAVRNAYKPNYDALLRDYPNTLINTSGEWVGLPDGQMGNSEVGHLNIGSGRVIQMDITRIDWMVRNGMFHTDPALQASVKHARGRRLHLMGLVSDGGVHSHNTHLYALLEMAKRAGLEDVVVHAFTDGRDTPPNEAAGFLEALQSKIREIGVGRIATVTGRYYAMDRDKRWERVERAFRAIVTGEGRKTADPVAAVKESYEKGVTDEFIEPVVIVNAQNEPTGLLRDEDAVIFFNFRADRGRELSMVLTDYPVDVPYKSLAPKNLHYTTMTVYDQTLKVHTVIKPETHTNLLGGVLAGHSRKQLRVAETEKYPHVTFFFNGGVEKPFDKEEREMVASPKVATYDLQPEMSAEGVCNVVLKGIERADFDVIVVNFANPDMVGHTGVYEAAVKACETCDVMLGRIHQALRAKGGQWIITADHGNAETMIDPVTGGPHTYHTTNAVPLILVNEERRPLRSGGSLRDLAPTVLGLLGLPKPAEMSGNDLRA
ncbi:MAG TPA: 2,3-bisphosphoglycerate-independent phosphoglycerate mutase [Bryobacteraceae bacterium]|nr:2,3-bisphosphoglycerate-independent phosphoglycerate mutase [Bryobacteraceae bacterium]